MHLNTIRLEGKLETDEFYDLADEQGLLIMAGWCCCDIWEEWNKWEPGYQLDVAKASLRSQILRMRSHPSMLVWLNGSDGPPTEDVERAYLQILQESAWPNPVLSSASATPTKPTGISGVKMTGPYDWVPPSYWLTDPGKYGGAIGFNTETSPGPAVQELACLRKFIPQDHLWPINEVWNFHAGGERFQNMDVFNSAMSAMYGPPSGLHDYLRKAQAMAYDGERAMFEAYGRNKYTATGVVQWMLNNAWPSTIWHLYDYYLHPAGGYYGTKKANEPLHIQYSYDDRSVVVVNSRYESATALTADVRVFDINLKQKFEYRGKVEVAADGVQPVVTIPVFPSEPDMETYFVALQLEDSAGKRASSNFYWLPRKTAVIAWEKTPDTTYTPVSSYDDLTALTSLPRVGLQLTESILENGKRVRLKLRNPGPHLAFQVHLDLKTDAQTFLPVMWDDDYFALMPGETRVITGSVADNQPLHRPTITVDGWNIEPLSKALARQH
jgi:exo-1,4-beta-D-glucosaminidase